MAKEKGFYEDVGLDVTVKERNPKKNNITQVVNGESEYGVADSVILRYRAKGYPVKVLATIFQHNAMVLLSKKGSGILSPYEMRGKRISFQRGLDDSIVSSLLKFANINKSDYIYSPMDFSKMDFVLDKVDITEAYLSIEPYWMKERYNIDVNVIDPRNYGIDLYGDLLFTTQEEIQKHPKRVESFTKATIKGWEYALKHKDETIKILLNNYNTRNYFTYDQLMYEAKITETLIAAHYIPLGTVQKDRFKSLANIYKKGLSQKAIDQAVETIIYDTSKQSNFLTKNINAILVILAILLLFIILLGFYNRRLNYLVKQRTSELENAKLEAEHAALSKSRFLANMSHEIRTPMNAILGFVEQIAKVEKNPESIKMLTIVQHSGQTLLGIINDILDFSKIESDKMKLDPKPCELQPFMEATLSMFEKSCLSKNITLSSHIDIATPMCITVDDIRLKQILINLLSNAIKFTPENGSITVKILYDDVTNVISFWVIDTGIGIDTQSLETIFKPFEQEDNSTTRKFGGTGLGLAISYRFAQLMGGNLNVQSVKDKGSTFTVSIPYISCTTACIHQPKQKEVTTQATLTGHILIVEDNKTNQMLLGIILDGLHLTYDIANDGVQAVEMYQKTKYDLILMDENMPNMNGIEATKIIRSIEQEKKLPAITIVAVTANALEGDKERFIAAGMDDYIAKPYDEQRITSVTNQYLL